jgi:hypothetical protein
MDGLIATIIAGLVVTVIGAILAFYFGGVREKHKREYEQQEAKQSELTRRRTEAIDQLRPRVYGIVTDVRSLGEKATNVVGKLPTGFVGRNFGSEPKLHEILRAYDQIMMQRDSIATEMEALRRYFMVEATYLPVTTRSIFESFNEEFDRRFTLLSAQIVDYEPIVGYRIAEHDRKSIAGKTYTAFMGIDIRKALKDLEKVWAGLSETAKPAREWNPQTYEAAFDKESKRIAGNRL